MIGWWVVIATQDPRTLDAADQEARRASILAQWEVGAGGIRWLAELVQAGKAEQLDTSGYPNRYTARADDVLLLLQNGGITPSKDGPWILGMDEDEQYVQPPGWIDAVELHADRCAACPADQVLSIEAWDLS